MAEVGRPSELNDELYLKIRDLVLLGKNMREIAEECGIAYKTMEGWCTRNYEGFADKMLTYKQSWRLQKAEENIDSILDIEIEQPVLEVNGAPARDREGNLIKKIDGKILKVKQETSQFVAETIGKKVYSKRNELTGADGKDFVFKWQDDSNNSVQTEKVGEGTPPEPEKVDSAGVAPESGENNSNA
jgi:hypothetical protein